MVTHPDFDVVKLKALLDGGSDDGDQSVGVESLRHVEDPWEEQVPSSFAVPLQAIRVEPQKTAAVFVSLLGAAISREQPGSDAHLSKGDPEGSYRGGRLALAVFFFLLFLILPVSTFSSRGKPPTMGGRFCHTKSESTSRSFRAAASRGRRPVRAFQLDSVLEA